MYTCAEFLENFNGQDLSRAHSYALLDLYKS